MRISILALVLLALPSVADAGNGGKWFPSRKAAKDAATYHGGYHSDPMLHDGHFHATDRKGKKIPALHFFFPKR